jgi:hypothetical protein
VTAQGGALGLGSGQLSCRGWKYPAESGTFRQKCPNRR